MVSCGVSDPPRDVVTLREFFSYALALKEIELGLDERRGSETLRRGPPEQCWAPPHADLTEMLVRAPDVDLYEGDWPEVVDQPLSLSDLAVVEAHFAVLKLLQDGSVRADAVIRGFGAPPSPDLSPRMALPPDIWRGGNWTSLPDEDTHWESGPVPDYEESSLGICPAPPDGRHAEVLRVEVSVDAVVAALGPPVPPQPVTGGTFRWNSGRIEIECGGKRANLVPTKGLGMILLLLAFPEEPLKWGVLNEAALSVIDGMTPHEAKRRAEASLGHRVGMPSAPFYTTDEIKNMKDHLKREQERGTAQKALDELSKYIRKAENNRMRRVMPHSKDQQLASKLVGPMLYAISKSCPPFVRHFGLVGRDNRKAVQTIIGTGWKYVPGTAVTWDTRPVFPSK